MKEEVHLEHNASFLSRLKTTWLKGANSLANFSYAVGLAIISIPRLPKLTSAYLLRHSWSNKKPSSLYGFLIMILVSLVPLGAMFMVSDGQILGGRVLGLSDILTGEISGAKDAIDKQDYRSAQKNLDSVLEQLAIMQSQLNDSNVVLESLIKSAPKEYNTQNLLEAAKLLVESGKEATAVMQILGQTNFSPEGISGPEGASGKEVLTALESSTKVLHQKLSAADILLSPLNTQFLPAEMQNAIINIKSLVKDLSAQTSYLEKVGKLANSIMGRDQAFLILLQNNNELRPTGGFIGTIAQGRFINGSISKLDIRSVYDLDGQLTEIVRPPEPMLAVNDRLYLRDSNWFANFSETSQLARTMYEKEGGETPEVVMAITPDLFVSLLEKTGPITLPTYKVTVSAKNFIETIQTSTSVAYDKSLNQPKQLLADLYPALIQRLSDISKDNPTTIMNILLDNLAKKNCVIHTTDSELQAIISDLKWAGDLTVTDRDYLMINSANLSGTKTDRLIDRGAELSTTISKDGSVINTIKYTVTNNLPENADLTNLSWVRFIVPRGSRLISAGGFSEKDLSQSPQRQYTDNSSLQAWQKSSGYDPSQKVWIGAEGSHTYFAAWMRVEGGKSQTAVITYQLPFILNKNLDRYSLIWERQIGMLPFPFIHQINTSGNKILWDNFGSQPYPADRSGSDNIKFEGLFENDSFLGLILKN